MWNLSRSLVCGAAALALLLPAGAASSGPGTSSPDGADRPDQASPRAERARKTEERLDRESLVGRLPGGASGRNEAPPETMPPFLGIDGAIHDRAPWVVNGLNGTVYIGQDFDGACFWGPRFARAMDKLARLATIIERSGRKVVFSVAPNKSSVNLGDLPASLPHGGCDRLGLARQNNLLDRFPDPRYLGLRELLASSTKAGRPMYWGVDTHWTTVGGTQYALELARRLDPRVADRQRYRSAEETILVDYNAIGVMDGVTETGPARFPTTRVRVRPVNGSNTFDPVAVSPSLEWRTRPAKRTVAGDTLLLGDSFMYRAMPSLLPLFQHGRFIWAGQQSMRETARAVKRSDTVVLEVVQRYLPISAIVSRDLRRAVADALRR